MSGHPLISKRWIGRIPVRNLWFLMLYASDLARFKGAFDALLDADIDDLPDLIARLLVNSVERRLRRNLSRQYRHRETVLTRVRGRIDMLTTESRALLQKGEVFCRFEELTIDTPRNRLIRAALALMARLVRDRDLARRCRALASILSRNGVAGSRPSRMDLVREQIGRNDATDRLVVTLALLAFDIALPTEQAGTSALFAPEREEHWVRRLFEKAVLGFLQVEFEPLGCRIRGSIPLEWQITSVTAGLRAVLPRMEADIIVDSPDGARLVVDTKFTSIFTSARFREVSLKSAYLYQMYSYLRSQEGRSREWECASGLFLHPSIEGSVRETATFQNHQITFATVDLSCSPDEIRSELRKIFEVGHQAALLQLL